MKKISFAFSLVLLLSGSLHAQELNESYDPVLAKKLNGNDHGMKKYVLVILKTGSNTTSDKALIDSLFAGHMKNIGYLADKGSLVVAGPLGKNDHTYRGIFIFNVETFEEAEKLLDMDPAVKEKLLEAELYTWYGSAALQETVNIHKSISKYKD